MAKKKKTPTIENRATERNSTNITAVVHFKENLDESWKEISELNTVSKNGAGMVVSQPCPVGRIVSLVLKMPRELRVYDLDEEIYPMLAVIQNCWASTVNEKPAFHIGCAFIGKKYPESFKADPTQCYRLTGMIENGLWAVTEAATPFKARRHSRFWRRIEATVSLRDQTTRTTTRENVFTREISAGGLSVWGPLDVNIGDRVKIACKEHDFYSMAKVTNLTNNEEDPKQSTIHFELVDSLFPIEKLFKPLADSDADGSETEAEVEQLPSVPENASVDSSGPNDHEVERFG